MYVCVYIYCIFYPPQSNHIIHFISTYVMCKRLRSSQFQGLPIYRFGSSFWGEAFAGHYTSWRFHAVLTACAATAPGLVV